MHEVIIIGSGLGGLLCAHILSKAGMSVLVLERQQQPGGCMQSYRRGGFNLDTGLHYVGGLDEGQSLHNVFSHLGLLQLPWQRLDADGFDRITIGDRTFCYAEGFGRFADTLASDFPHQQQALRTYVDALQHSTPQQMGIGAWDFLNETFSDTLLVNVLAGSSLKMELHKPSLSLFAFAHSNASFVESSWRLRGDGNMLVGKLVDDIRRQGGEVLCKKEVVRLLTNETGAVAVECGDGTRYEARHFISDAHPAQTLQWLGRVKPVYRRRICEQPNTIGIFTASLVLKPHSLRYFNHNRYVYLRPNVWEVPQQVDRVMVCCRVPEDGSEYTPQVDLLTPMTWEQCEPWAATSIGQRGDGYKAMKVQMAEACLQLAERVLPELPQAVAHCYTSTPLTYRDYTLTPQGSAFGMRKDYHQPLLTIISPRTPVPNLLLTGQSLMLHGVHGVTFTALHTCAELLGKDYIMQHYETTIN